MTTTNKQAFGQTMAKYAAGIITQAHATTRLEALHIRGGFADGAFTGFDYEDQIWRKSTFTPSGVAITSEGTGS